MHIAPLVSALALAAGLAASGCALSASGSASASLSVEPGHFFGHDLTRTRSVVYVIDLSGSMAEESGSVVSRAATGAGAELAGGFTGGLLGSSAGYAVEDKVRDLDKKIEKVKLHLIASLQGLPTGARFDVVLFSDGVQTLAPGLIEANPATIGLVSAFVSQLEEGGGTNMYAAVEAAVFSGAEEIILLTDGMPTSSTPGEIVDLVRRNNGGRFTLSTVGVGGDQAREFLATLAADNGGSYTFYE